MQYRITETKKLGITQFVGALYTDDGRRVVWVTANGERRNTVVAFSAAGALTALRETVRRFPKTQAKAA